MLPFIVMSLTSHLRVLEIESFAELPMTNLASDPFVTLSRETHHTTVPLNADIMCS